MPVRIYFVRQGITDYHLFRIVPGHLPLPLNDIGRSQAEATAELMKGVPFNSIYIADARACEETAAIIFHKAQRRPKHIRKPCELRTRDVGSSAGEFCWDVLETDQGRVWEPFDSIRARASSWIRREIIPLAYQKRKRFVVAVVCDDFIRCLPSALAPSVRNGGCSVPMTLAQAPEESGISASVRSGSVSILEIDSQGFGSWLTYGFADHMTTDLATYKDPLTAFDLNRNINRDAPPPWRRAGRGLTREKSRYAGTRGSQHSAYRRSRTFATLSAVSTAWTTPILPSMRSAASWDEDTSANDDMTGTVSIRL